MSFFVLKNELYDELHVEEMVKVIEICQPYRVGYLKTELCIVIGIFLKKYYRLKLKFLNNQDLDVMFSSTESYIYGFEPSLTLHDVVLFLLEKNIISVFKSSDNRKMYKLV